MIIIPTSGKSYGLTLVLVNDNGIQESCVATLVDMCCLMDQVFPLAAVFKCLSYVNNVIAEDCAIKVFCELDADSFLI